MYECLPGWQTSTAGISSFDQLPQRAQDYIRYLEAQTGVEVGCISTAPGARSRRSSYQARDSSSYSAKTGPVTGRHGLVAAVDTRLQ